MNTYDVIRCVLVAPDLELVVLRTPDNRYEIVLHGGQLDGERIPCGKDRDRAVELARQEARRGVRG